MRRNLGEAVVLKMHDFSRAEGATRQSRAFATERLPLVEDAFPQGLKPGSFLAMLLARLKSCPFKAGLFKADSFKAGVFKAGSLKPDSLKPGFCSADFFKEPRICRLVHVVWAIAFIFAMAAQGAFAQAPQPAAAASYRIAGTVVNAVTGEPVRRASVAVLTTESDQTVMSVETDNEGRFAFEDLAAAKYPLTASKRGFLTSSFDQHDGGFSTAIVTGEGQETTGLVFRLMPGAVLHGVVTGDGGDPVENARVMLFMKPHNHNPWSRTTQAGEALTDDTGAYEFDGLAAGDYLLAVKAKPWYALYSLADKERKRPENDPAAALDVAYPVTFFDATTDESSATTIALAGGSRDEANINLHAAPALHLLVPAPGGPNGSVTTPILRQSVLGTPLVSVGAGFVPGGETMLMEFTGVSPGHYELTQGDPPHIMELDATASQQVDPSLGTPTVAISGTLQRPPGVALPENLTLLLSSLDAANGQTSLQANTVKGSFSFEGVSPGTWQLSAFSPGKSLSVSSIIVGTKAQQGSHFTVKEKPVQIEATICLGETRVEGFAKENGRGVAGVMVVLVPRNPAANNDQFRRDQSDSDGSFSLHGVVPGEYTVVAIEDGWELDWSRPEVIERFLPNGIAVVVSESSGKLVRLSEGVKVQSRSQESGNEKGTGLH
jgi:5-hydroxyisourate hydrolase-like protein (transthyretin family)